MYVKLCPIRIFWEDISRQMSKVHSNLYSYDRSYLFISLLESGSFIVRSLQLAVWLELGLQWNCFACDFRRKGNLL